MSDTIIHVKDLTKVYRLYTKPLYRFLDMFGLLYKKEGAYTEHAALDRISLDIQRGEKVAIIGRNGAGKSTFLKLVTRVIQPTSGEVEVQGRVHALLQIGTGFHPDFTGRENAYAYLAQLGITGKEADRKFVEIVDFAELEEYINQPLKTYSTGMAVRLMFSTSTAITPDILVLDEVLGVGDAYFAQKSFGRMKELCEGMGATLLLVTHDIYSAVKIASRVIWIDQGRIFMDGKGSIVAKAYEDSVREQEERRLRKRKRAQLQALRNVRIGALDHILIEIQGHENKPQPCPVYFSRIALCRNGKQIDSLPLGPEAFSSPEDSHLQRESTSWGDMIFWEGRLSRPMLNYGSPFHKVAGVFVASDFLTELESFEFELVLEYWSEVSCDLVLRAFIKEQEITLGHLSSTQGEWTKYSIPLYYKIKKNEQTVSGSLPEINPTGVHGSGAITILDVKILNDKGQEAYLLSHGKPMDLLIRYRIQKLDLKEKAQVLIGFHRDGVQSICRILTRDLLFDATEKSQGTVRLHLPKLMLADGTYSITITIAEERYYDQDQTLYFSINPGVYNCIARMFDIVVQDGGIVGSGTGVVAEGDWCIL